MSYARLISVLFIVIMSPDVRLPLSAQEGDSAVLTRQRILELAHRVATVQQEYRNFRLAYVLLRGWPSNKDLKEQVSHFNFRVPGDDMVCTYWDQDNRWDSAFNCLRCIYLGTIPETMYAMAISLKGSLYLLKGFEERDFDRLMRHFVAPIDQAEKAVHVAMLYMRTVALVGWHGRIIIDATNIGELKPKYSFLHEPRVVSKTSPFDVHVLTLDVVPGVVTLHEISVASSGEITYSQRELIE